VNRCSIGVSDGLGTVVVMTLYLDHAGSSGVVQVQAVPTTNPIRDATTCPSISS